MRLLSRYLKQLAIITSLVLGLSASALAIENPNNSATAPASTNQLLWELSNYISHAIDAAVKTQQNLMYQPTPGIENTYTSNSQSRCI